MTAMDEDRVIEVSLLKSCPVGCEYCPQDVLRHASRAAGVTQGQMTPETLSDIVRNAASGVPGVTVAFSGFSEPFKHPRAADMMELCERSPYVRRIAVYTTGEGLQAPDVERVGRLSKLVKFTVHIDAFGGPQRTLSGQIWQHLPQIARCVRQAVVLMVRDSVDLKQIALVSEHVKQFGIPFGTSTAISRSANILRLVRTGESSTAVTCDKMGKSKAPVVLPDGTCVACCNDYGLTLPLGNLARQTWTELDFDSVIRKQRDPSSGAICFRDCHFARPAAST